MEDRLGAAALIGAAGTSTRVARPASLPPQRGAGGWIVSPAYDLLFLANLGWLILLLPGLSTRTETVVDFWQVYFLTLPHRWITLGLVALDPDRRAGRDLRLGLIAAALLVVVAGVWFGTAALTCLAVVDYGWNAWHFAAQHAGVLRIYTRMVGGGWAWLDRWGVRLFVTYTILRTAGWATGWLEAGESTLSWLRAFDAAAMLIPTALVARALLDARRDRLGRLVYVLSLSSLYGGLLVALSLQRSRWVVILTTASSLFHAVEYLAVVTHYAWRRREVGSDGAFRAMAKGWLLYLGGYAALLGAAGVWLDRVDQPFYELWQGVNLWAALVHYAYDGMIWKLRRPETARALGIGPGVAVS